MQVGLVKVRRYRRRLWRKKHHTDMHPADHRQPFMDEGRRQQRLRQQAGRVGVGQFLGDLPADRRLQRRAEVGAGVLGVHTCSSPVRTRGGNVSSACKYLSKLLSTSPSGGGGT